MTTSSGPTFQFDVALSFAGEDRAYAGEIAERLRSHGVQVFYDQYEQATLWGKDLYEHLDYVYQRGRSVLCVVCVRTLRAQGLDKPRAEKRSSSGTSGK